MKYEVPFLASVVFEQLRSRLRLERVFCATHELELELYPLFTKQLNAISVKPTEELQLIDQIKLLVSLSTPRTFSLNSCNHVSIYSISDTDHFSFYRRADHGTSLTIVQSCARNSICSRRIRSHSQFFHNPRVEDRDVFLRHTNFLTESASNVKCAVYTINREVFTCLAVQGLQKNSDSTTQETSSNLFVEVSHDGWKSVIRSRDILSDRPLNIFCEYDDSCTLSPEEIVFCLKMKYLDFSTDLSHEETYQINESLNVFGEST